MKSKKVIHLKVVNDDAVKARAKDNRRKLYKTVREVVADYGSTLDGFAIVAWNRKGEANTSLMTGEGMELRKIPSFCGDLLMQHVAVSLAKDN